MRCTATRNHVCLVIWSVALGLVFVVRGARPQKRPDAHQPGSPAVDLYGDMLPDGAIARLGTIRNRTAGWAQGVKFIPNTATYVVGTEGGSLRFHDAETGRLTKEFLFGGARLQAFDISRDGATIATLSALRLADTRDFSALLQLWDVQSGRNFSVFQWIEPLEEQTLHLAFSPDAKVIAAGTRNGNVRFWDTASGDELETVSVVERGQVEAIAISPTGETVAVASRAGVFLWERTNEEPPQKLAGLERGARFVVFSPDGKWLVTGSGDGAGCRLYDADTLQLVRGLAGHSRWHYIQGAAFDPLGRWLVVPADETSVEVWDVTSGELARVLPSDRVGIDEVAVSSDGKYLVGIGSRATVRVWDFATGEPIGTQFVGHNEAPYEIEFTPDGAAVVTGDISGLLYVWDASSGKPLHMLGHERWVSALVVSPDGRHIASAGHDDTIRVWDVKTGKLIFKLYGHGRLGGKYKLAFAPGGQTFASFGPDMYLRTWDMRTGKCLTEHAVRPQKMQIQEDEDGNVIQGRDPFGGGLMDSSGKSLFSAAASLLLLPHGGDLYVFDVQSGRKLRTFAPGGAAFDQFALSPDGKRLVSLATQRRGGPTTVTTELRVVDVATNEIRVRRELDGRYFRQPRFSPDGSLWAMSGSGTGGGEEGWISIWSIESAEEVARVPGGATAIAFSPNNSRLATSQSDTSVLIWDLARFRADRD